jgi:hypothetical protein
VRQYPSIATSAPLEAKREAAVREQQLGLEVISLQQPLVDREQQLACSQATIDRLQQQLAAAEARSHL